MAKSEAQQLARHVQRNTGRKYTSALFWVRKYWDTLHDMLERDVTGKSKQEALKKLALRLHDSQGEDNE